MSRGRFRVRMFAGPNGSGKSTLKSILPAELRGVYLNPDEIEAAIRSEEQFDLNAYEVPQQAQDLLSFLLEAAVLQSPDLRDATHQLKAVGSTLDFREATVNSYFASAIADYLRFNLLEARVSFTFETVMSHPDKVEFLKQAHLRGARTYLYYIATEDPQINVERVQTRVRLGGHPVPEEKIRSRYHRSLNLLVEAIRASDRAYIFDNSGGPDDLLWIAQLTDGSVLQIESDSVPEWFDQAVLQKLSTEPFD